MDRSALEQMHLEMQEVLEYNFNHFYTRFKDIIIDELVDNFETIISKYNFNIDSTNIKTRLKQ